MGSVDPAHSQTDPKWGLTERRCMWPWSHLEHLSIREPLGSVSETRHSQLHKHTNQSLPEGGWGSAGRKTLGSVNYFVIPQSEATSFLLVNAELDGCLINVPNKNDFMCSLFWMPATVLIKTLTVGVHYAWQIATTEMGFAWSWRGQRRGDFLYFIPWQYFWFYSSTLKTAVIPSTLNAVENALEKAFIWHMEGTLPLHTPFFLSSQARLKQPSFGFCLI